jgi:hypothetical protein
MHHHIHILLVILIIFVVELTNAFVIPSSTSSYKNTRCYINFLKDAFDNAFANDRNLSGDRGKGQYDDIFTGEEYVETNVKNDEGLTDIQKKWRQQTQSSSSSSSSGDNDMNMNSNNNIDHSDMIVGTSLTLEIYLAGVPERDPSNDLYGSRVNISSRDKDTGLSLPSAPSVKIQLDFLNDGICTVSESSFTAGSTIADDDGSGSGSNNQWKLSDDNKFLRFSMDTLGYTRTVETKGSIQNVYWTDEEEKTVQTSTTYSVPPGPVYGDIKIINRNRNRNRKTFVELGKDGVLRLEQSSGLFGIASKMVACGKFIVAANTRNNDNDNNNNNNNNDNDDDDDQ